MAVFYNQATISYNGNVTGSNIVTGEIIEVLSAEKNSLHETYSPDKHSVFVISIVNTGNSDYTGLTVTDDLGAYDFGTPPVQLVPMNYVEDSVMYYVNGNLQSAPNVTSEFPLTIEGINVPAGGNAVIIYETAVNEYAPLGENSEITNTAEITGAGLAEAVTASAAITPDNTPRLSISKSLCPATVPENGVINYSFIIQNFGTQPVTENDTVIFSDTFDPILDIDTVTFNGNTWTATNDYTYSTSTGEFVSQTGKITVPPAQYVRNPETGEWTVQPGVSTLLISGNIFTSIEKT